MGFSKDSRERLMMGEFYRLYEKWSELGKNMTPERWEQLIMETDDFSATYCTDGDKTASHLAALVLGVACDNNRNAHLIEGEAPVIINEVAQTSTLEVFAAIFANGIIGRGM